MKNNFKQPTAILSLVLILSAAAFPQSGGSYEITQSVIANGGAKSDSGTFSLTGTNGQTLAGTNSTGGGFAMRGGFWQGFFNPTAAVVGVSGRVAQANGKGVFGAQVTLTGAGGTMRTTGTNFFGKFRFDDIEAGQTYIFSVSHKRYLFINNTQILTILEENTDVNFTAEPQW